MSFKYELLKKLVVTAGLKKRWLSATTEELLENRRKQNAKNRIPALKDEALEVSRIDVMGCPVLKLIHKEQTDRANLFLIGGGMISAPRPASIKKALRFAKETGLDLFIPYYPLCTDYPLTKAYEMIHETYKAMLRDYAPGMYPFWVHRQAGIWHWAWCHTSMTDIGIPRCQVISWRFPPEPVWTPRKSGSGWSNWTKRTSPSRLNI